MHSNEVNKTAKIAWQRIKEFIQIIHNWCSPVNVKHPDKGKHLRDFHANTIQNMPQENINYLKE
jgi:hypothetical protein